MTLEQFLNQNTVENLTKEVAISKRFVDEEGNFLKFKIKPLTQAKNKELRKKSTIVDSKGNMTFDDDKYNISVAIENTITPNFKSSENHLAVGVSSAEGYISKVLLLGEIRNLVDEIFKLSGFGTNMAELVEEAKN